MIYAINLLYTELITYLIGVLYGGKKLSLASFLFIISPVLLLWLLIAGGQLNVGTDYNSYMELFNGGDLSRYEPGFIYILSYVQDYGFHGQFFYYLFYGIGFIFLGSILYHLNPKNLYIFIFIFLTFTGLFHNQLNILRQAIATYIGTYGVIMSVNGKKLTAIMMFLFASSIHFCALIFFFLVSIKHISLLDKKLMFVLLCLSVLMSFVFSISTLQYIDFLIPDIYKRFIIASSIEERSIMMKVTKYIFVPFFLLSLLNIESYDLSKKQLTLYRIGFMAICLKLSFLNLTIISRIVDFFIILSIFPLFYYFIYLKDKHRISFYFIVLLFTAIYLSKVILFPSNEYLYQSIYPSIF